MKNPLKRRACALVLSVTALAGCVTAPHGHVTDGGVLHIGLKILDDSGYLAPLTERPVDAELLLGVIDGAITGRPTRNVLYIPVHAEQALDVRVVAIARALAAGSAPLPVRSGSAGLRVVPADAHVARMSTVLLSSGPRPFTTGFYDSATKRGLLLLSVDRPCRVSGPQIDQKDGSSSVPWSVELVSPGVQWVEFQRGSDGSLVLAAPARAVRPVLFAQPGQAPGDGFPDLSHTDVLGKAHPPGVWKTASNTDCKVWNPQPEPNESVTWTGGCLHGYADGQGVLQWTVQGSLSTRVDAPFLKGRPEGVGTYVLRSGVRFEGTFVDGEPSGQGAITWPNGDRYVGGFKEGKQTGRGMWADSHGDRYDGEFRNGMRTGIGVLTTAKGERYEGDWLYNLREGRGVQTYADGSRYEGEWTFNGPSRLGTKTWPDGRRYTGRFVNGEPAGPN